MPNRVRKLKIDCYLDNNSKWRARIMAGNGEQLARTKGSEFSEDRIQSTVDETLKTFADGERPEIYESSNSEWYWRMGCLQSSEGYVNKTHCTQMAALVLKGDYAND